MIKEQNRLFKKVQLFSDALLVVISFFIGYLLRDKISVIYPFEFLRDFFQEQNLSAFGHYIIYIGHLPVLVVIWISLLSYFGMYKSAGVPRISETLTIVFKSTIVGFVLFGSYVFVLRMQEDISRLFIGFSFLSAAILLISEKILLFYIVRILSVRDTNFKSALIVFRRILVVGTNNRARQFVKLINKNPEWGIRIVGLVDITPGKTGEVINGHKVIGSLDDISEIINKEVIDEIVFIVPRSWLNKIENIILYCESAGLKVNLAVNLFELKFSKAQQTELDGFPLLSFESRSFKVGHFFIKRVIDFIASGIGLMLLSPVLLATIILIKTTSTGPAFFRQMRVTLHGRQFILYKFRTMIADAEDKLKELICYNEMDGPVFKMTDDPRITKVGKWLRKFSIDELPQLWNVVKGDMSLVGPRPPLPHEVEKYDTWQRRRLSMRPGITCLWQASGRNKIVDFKEWMRLDLEYIDNWSLSLDFKIICKTIPVVLFGIGAK